jgi:hypothetical protein
MNSEKNSHIHPHASHLLPFPLIVMYKKDSDYVIPNQGRWEDYAQSANNNDGRRISKARRETREESDHPGQWRERQYREMGYFEQGDGVRYVERKNAALYNESVSARMPR